MRYMDVDVQFELTVGYIEDIYNLGVYSIYLNIRLVELQTTLYIGIIRLAKF